MSVLFDGNSKGQGTFNHGQEKAKTERVHDSLLRKKIGFESLAISSCSEAHSLLISIYETLCHEKSKQSFSQCLFSQGTGVMVLVVGVVIVVRAMLSLTGMSSTLRP